MSSSRDSAETVTLDVPQLRALLYAPDRSELWVNLPFTPERYQHSIRVNVLRGNERDPVFRFERLLNTTRTDIVEIPASHIFDYFQRIARVLAIAEEQRGV